MRYALALVVSLAVLACSKQKELSINWEGSKATSVTIPVTDSVSIYVEDSDFEVLGEQDIGGEVTTFTPVVPFERGQTYRVMSSTRFVFTVPRDTMLIAPRLLNAYPSCDTVPENLLKVYLQFDQPMMEGRSANHVVLFDETSQDTVVGAFLDLQPELWNEDQTILTLWLDPGRVKQDLIPNKELGAVLNKNHRYRLVTTDGWRSKSGLKTEKDFVRTFLTTQRDTKKPAATNWNVAASPSGITISFKESLDWSLLNSAISVRKGNEKVVTKISVDACERTLHLVPVEPLNAGKYTVEVEGRLEDLAGNNLNRLFETDVTDDKQVSQQKFIHTIQVEVR